MNEYDKPLAGQHGDGAYDLPQTAAAPTGRELDALVAEKVMGWTNIVWRAKGIHPRGCPPETPSIVYQVPYFSIDIGGAWLVIEHCIAQGLDVELETLAEYSHQWRCCIGSAKECWHVYHTDSSAAVAICLAALAAVRHSTAAAPGRADD